MGAILDAVWQRLTRLANTVCTYGLRGDSLRRPHAGRRTPPRGIKSPEFPGVNVPVRGLIGTHLRCMT